MPGTADLVSAYEELEAARVDVVEADDMYEGDVGEVYASPKVKRMLRRANADQVEEFNYAHIPVDTVANRLQVVSVTIATDEDEQGQRQKGDGDAAEKRDTEDAKAPKTKSRAGEGKAPDAASRDRNADAQAVLDKLREDNQLDAEEPGLWLNASRNGDCYLVVWPVTDDSGKVTGVDMRVNAATTTRMIYDEEDPLKIAYAIKSWTYDEQTKDGKRTRTRVTLYYDDRVERWISKPDKKGKALCKEDAWEPYADDDQPAVINHDYGRVPVFHYRNARPYGRPEHRFAYGPQQLLNKLVQAHSVSVDFQSFPQRWALIDPTADQPMGNFLDPLHPEDDDDPEGEGNTSQLSGDPSAVWKLWAKNVGQFDPASPDTFLKPFDRYVQAMAELTETPLYRFGSAFAQTPSGAALRVADAPTVNKVEARQGAYDAVHEDAHQFALELMGYKGVRVKVTWKPAEQETDFEAWSVVGQKIDAGVPRKQALIETGYPEEAVDEWFGQEAEDDAVLRRKVDLLTLIANGAQSLGAAVTMGVLDQADVKDLLRQLLGKDEAPATKEKEPVEQVSSGG